MKAFGGFPNKASIAYYLLKNAEEAAKDILFISEDDIEADSFFELSNSIKKIFSKDIELIKFDTDKDNIKKGVEKIYNSNKTKIIFSSLKSSNIGFPKKDNLYFARFKVGDLVKRSEIMDKLLSNGFIRTSFVESSGQFAVRGMVIDIFEYGADYPYRLYFDGDRIEAIRKFDIETQNTFDFAMEVSVSGLNKKETVLTELGFEKYSDFYINEEITVLSPDFSDSNVSYFNNIKFSDFSIFKKEMERFQDLGFDIYLFYLNDKEALRIERVLEENRISLKNIRFVQGYIDKGFFSKTDKLALISSNEIFNRDYDYYSVKKKAKKFYRLNELSVGDYVVHEEYGIGVFKGIKDFSHKDEWGNVYTSECIEIEYAKGDKLFVSLDDFKKIQKYVGGDKGKVRVSALNSFYWKNLREKVKKEIEQVAKDIIKLEAKRKVLKIKPMVKTRAEEDFESDFIYDETPDQLRAIEDVLKDLETGEISNRVIVGDVGFGKTEVAMRAVFRAVANGFQCCVLAPTTILAEQHYRNFKKRFEKYQINVEVITRLTPLKRQKQIISDISSGVIDVIIGTHKLLSDNIKFKNLGIMVIDEEHKFGVKQKEEIKKKQHLAHMLYLSATPIPRTLYQSLSNIRTMSVIETPPMGRLPVDTRVVSYDENIIISAVNEEIKRKGQIYYVYNRVEFINQKAEKLSKLLPGVRIAVVHGQMDGEEIEDVMMDFLENKYDLLLASTIIESGIDIPSVNTLIVEDAHKLGLAQLYQLRGRIGREKRKAYCYLFYPKWFEKENGETLNSDMMKRLFALEEFSELGSGFRLAMRDLEIRGAGELLGTKQHGFISAVGLDMYIKLLNNEIKKIKGEKVETEEDIVLDIKVSAFIPDNYISDDLERLNFYKRISSSDIDKIDDVVSKMTDMAGPAPKEVLNFVDMVKIKKSLKGKGVKKIIEKEFKLEFYFSKDFNPSASDLSRWQKSFGEGLKFFKTSSGDGFEIKIYNRDRIETIKEVFNLNAR
ncbi:MAG: DEAD/DEAH box helicase [Elusimicrobiales bacterium]